MARRQRGMPQAMGKLQQLGVGGGPKANPSSSFAGRAGGFKGLAGRAMGAAKTMKLKKGLGGKAGGY